MDSANCPGDVDAQPLKKRPTKRGLTSVKTRSEDTISDYTAETNVYSGCVQRSSIFALTNLSSCTPLLPIYNNHEQKLSEIALSASTQPIEPKTAKAAQRTDFVIDLDQCDENSSSSGNNFRSPSPPPPPPVPVRKKPRRAKGIKNALQTLNNMKGALSLSSPLSMSTLSPVIIDDSPAHHTLTVRIRHISTVHKFSMPETELFYKLQQQMATILHVEAERVGLFLNDRRLGGGDTPQSVNLHLADIVECHILVPRETDSQQAEVGDKDACRVVLQCSNMRRNKEMTIKKYMPFKVLFENYAKLQDRPLSSFKFRFDGELLSADDTPYDIDLEDGDTIDVIEI